MMSGARTVQYLATGIALLVGLDTWVAIEASGVTAERVSLAKVLAALGCQAVAIGLLALTLRFRRESLSPTGPLEQFRAWATPYFIFAAAVGFSLSLLYNAVACGEQSFLHARRGEPACKL
jgi:hypothetical protein